MSKRGFDWYYRETKNLMGGTKPEFECFPDEQRPSCFEWEGPFDDEEKAMMQYWADHYTEICADVTDLALVIILPEVADAMFPQPEEIENVKEWSWEHWSMLMYIESILVGSSNNQKFRVDPDCDIPECILYKDLANEKFIESRDGFYVLTEKGWYTVGQLRRHQAEGKRVFDFEYC